MPDVKEAKVEKFRLSRDQKDFMRNHKKYRLLFDLIQAKGMGELAKLDETNYMAKMLKLSYDGFMQKMPQLKTEVPGMDFSDVDQSQISNEQATIRY